MDPSEVHVHESDSLTHGATSASHTGFTFGYQSLKPGSTSSSYFTHPMTPSYPEYSDCSPIGYGTGNVHSVYEDNVHHAGMTNSTADTRIHQENFSNFDHHGNSHTIGPHHTHSHPEQLNQPFQWQIRTNDQGHAHTSHSIQAPFCGSVLPHSLPAPVPVSIQPMNMNTSGLIHSDTRLLIDDRALHNRYDFSDIRAHDLERDKNLNAYDGGSITSYNPGVTPSNWHPSGPFDCGGSSPGRTLPLTPCGYSVQHRPSNSVAHSFKEHDGRFHANAKNRLTTHRPDTGRLINYPTQPVHISPSSAPNIQGTNFNSHDSNRLQFPQERMNMGHNQNRHFEMSHSGTNHGSRAHVGLHLGVTRGSPPCHSSETQGANERRNAPGRLSTYLGTQSNIHGHNTNMGNVLVTRIIRYDPVMTTGTHQAMIHPSLVEAAMDPELRKLIMKADNDILYMVHNNYTRTSNSSSFGSFQRMLLHKVADFYGVDRELYGPSNEPLVMNFLPGAYTRIPPISLSRYFENISHNQRLGFSEPITRPRTTQSSRELKYFPGIRHSPAIQKPESSVVTDGQNINENHDHYLVGMSRQELITNFSCATPSRVSSDGRVLQNVVGRPEEFASQSNLYFDGLEVSQESTQFTNRSTFTDDGVKVHSHITQQGDITFHGNNSSEKVCGPDSG